MLYPHYTTGCLPLGACHFCHQCPRSQVKPGHAFREADADSEAWAPSIENLYLTMEEQHLQVLERLSFWSTKGGKRHDWFLRSWTDLDWYGIHWFVGWRIGGYLVLTDLREDPLKQCEWGSSQHRHAGKTLELNGHNTQTQTHRHKYIYIHIHMHVCIYVCVIHNLVKWQNIV